MAAKAPSAVALDVLVGIAKDQLRPAADRIQAAATILQHERTQKFNGGIGGTFR